MNRTLALAVFLTGCTFVPPEPEPDPSEPIEAPEDPAEPGAPVGIRTVLFEGETFEVWYPAPAGLAGAAGQPLPVDELISEAVQNRLPNLDLPPLESTALRDAPPRVVPSSLPVLLFSHGFGGFRTQSASLCAHMASRGYVVVAPDHPGRMLGDVLPCIFDGIPGCDFSGIGGEDVAIDDLLAARRWVQTAADDESGFLFGLADATNIGIFGHSAGGGSAMELGGLDANISAVLAMAAAASTDAIKPTALVGGACDAFADPESMTGALSDLADGVWVNVLDAGHMPFSDLCSLDLGGVAEEFLVGEPDVDPTFLNQLLSLATSGCPGYPPAAEPVCSDEYLALDVSQRIINHYVTRFFDHALLGRGGPINDGAYDEAEVTVP